MTTNWQQLHPKDIATDGVHIVDVDKWKSVNALDNLPRTIFSDIDGTLLKHWGSIEKILENPPEVLPGVKDKLQEWNLKDYKIILTTGRRESMRDFTIAQLKECGISYDLLIMGCRRGTRVVINDRKPDSLEDTAKGITLERNKGMEGLEI